MQGLLTELDAVNGMLMAIHEQPVSSLDDVDIEELGVAKQTLQEISRTVQAEGWHFNTFRNQTLLPIEPDKEIWVPANCLRVDTIGPSRGINVVQHGLKLFNTSKGTYRFDGPLTVELLKMLPFDQLIQPARDYIMIRATRRFQARVVESQAVEYFTEREEVQALAALKHSEADTGDYNVLTDSPLSLYTNRRDRWL